MSAHTITVRDLRAFDLFDDLTEEELEGWLPSVGRRVTAAYTPRSGLSGATLQSEPKVTMAPASINDRNAYAALARSLPIFFSAHRPSSMQ